MQKWAENCHILLLMMMTRVQRVGPSNETYQKYCPQTITAADGLRSLTLLRGVVKAG